MIFSARPYQVEMFEAARDAFRAGTRHVIIEAATGLGKTICFAMMANMTRERGKKTLILVNRDNLAKQAVDKYFRVTKDHPSVEMGTEKGSRHTSVVVGSIQTMQGKRLLGWAKNHFDLVILDECHIGASKTARNTINHFDAYRVGFSATVERSDNQGIGSMFEKIVYRKGILDAIDEGWLVPLDFQKIPIPVTLDETIATKKTLTEAEEEYALEPYVERLVFELGLMIGTHKSLVFCPETKSSKAVSQMLGDRGLIAKHIDCYMNDYRRDDILDWFSKCTGGVLSCAMLLATGYDNASITAIAILRLIKSTPLFIQICGRVTRPLCDVDSMPDADARRALIAASAKPKGTILDILIQSDNHNIAQPSCLISTLKDERAAIDKKQSAWTGQTFTIEMMKAAVEEKRINDTAEQLRKVADLAANAARKNTRHNGDHPYIHDILQRDDGGVGLTDNQARALRNFKAPVEINTLSKSQATRIIGRYIKHLERKKLLV